MLEPDHLGADVTAPVVSTPAEPRDPAEPRWKPGDVVRWADVLTPAEQFARDRGICGAHTEPSGFLRAATCELLHGHTGWHRDGGMSWVDRSYDPAERERAAYERGKAEQAAEVAEWKRRFEEQATRGDQAAQQLLALHRELSEARLLLEQAEQYARDLQDSGATEIPDHLLGDGPCQDCGAENIRWYADSPFWNLVIGGPGQRDDPGGIFCIRCFVKRADRAGFNPSAWRISLPADQSGGSDAS